MNAFRLLLLDLLEKEATGQVVGAMIVVEFPNSTYDLTGYSPNNLARLIEKAAPLMANAQDLIPESRVH